MAKYVAAAIALIAVFSVPVQSRAASYGPQWRTEYRPPALDSSVGKYATAAMWVRYSTDVGFTSRMERLSFKASTGNCNAGVTGRWTNDYVKTFYWNGNTFFYGGGLTGTNCSVNPPEGGNTFAWTVSNVVYGYHYLTVSNTVDTSTSSPTTYQARLRVADGSVQYLNVNWLTVPATAY